MRNNRTMLACLVALFLVCLPLSAEQDIDKQALDLG